MTKLYLGDFYFRSQRALRDRIRDIISQREPGVRLWECADFRLLCQVLKRHPNYLEKTRGLEVSAFLVVLHPMGHKELWLERSDGSQESFSWVKCVRGKAQDFLSQLHTAMRNSVRIAREQVKAQAVCDLCGVSTEDLEVDHKHPTMRQIIKDFLDRYPACFGEEAIHSDPYTQMLRLSPTHPVTRLWRTYHDEVAVLQVLCLPCHKMKSKIEQVEVVIG